MRGGMEMGVAQDPVRRPVFIGLYHGGFEEKEIAAHPNIGLTYSRVRELMIRMEKEGWVKPEIREASKIMLKRSHDLKWISPQKRKLCGNQGHSNTVKETTKLGRWSDWFTLERCALLKENVSHEPGIYEIRLNREFGRVRGTTRIVNIGMAAKSLNDRVYRQKACDPIRNYSGTMKWLMLEDAEFEVRWFVVSSEEEAKRAEDQRIAEFICRHWEMPPGQLKPPTVGGTRVTDLRVKKLIDKCCPEYVDIDLSNNDIAGLNDPARKCEDG